MTRQKTCEFIGADLSAAQKQEIVDRVAVHADRLLNVMGKALADEMCAIERETGRGFTKSEQVSLLVSCAMNLACRTIAFTAEDPAMAVHHATELGKSMVKITISALDEKLHQDSMHFTPRPAPPRGDVQ